MFQLEVNCQFKNIGMFEVKEKLRNNFNNKIKLIDKYCRE